MLTYFLIKLLYMMSSNTYPFAHKTLKCDNVIFFMPQYLKSFMIDCDNKRKKIYLSVLLFDRENTLSLVWKYMNY